MKTSIKHIEKNDIELKKESIKEIKIEYPNILQTKNLYIYINGEKTNNSIIIEDSILTPKDFGGLLLSKLNNISLQTVKCSKCNKYHSDNGKFAYTKHRTHLCLYCGQLFKVEEKNIGNEIPLYFNIPDIVLMDKSMNITDKICLDYNLFKGELLVNGEVVDKVIVNNREQCLKDILNDLLKDEY